MNSRGSGGSSAIREPNRAIGKQGRRGGVATASKRARSEKTDDRQRAPLELSREEVQLVKDYIKVPPAPPGTSPAIQIGAVVPPGLLVPLPPQIGEKYPRLIGSRFMTDRNGAIVIVTRGGRNLDVVVDELHFFADSNSSGARWRPSALFGRELVLTPSAHCDPIAKPACRRSLDPTSSRRMPESSFLRLLIWAIKYSVKTTIQVAATSRAFAPLERRARLHPYRDRALLSLPATCPGPRYALGACMHARDQANGRVPAFSSPAAEPSPARPDPVTRSSALPRFTEELDGSVRWRATNSLLG